MFQNNANKCEILDKHTTEIISNDTFNLTNNNKINGK